LGARVPSAGQGALPTQDSVEERRDVEFEPVGFVAKLAALVPPPLRT